MTTSRAAQLLRKPDQPERASFLELFFDLVFVFALARVSRRLIEDITSDERVVLAEAARTLLVLLAIWMVWSATVLITDVYDPDHPQIQLLIVWTMFGSLVMAVAVSEAFDRRAVAFASAYVAIHLGRGLYLVPALRGHESQLRAARVLFWFGVSAVPWMTGAVLHESVIRGSLWTVAMAIDYAALLFRLPVPKLGRPPESELPVVPEHLAERYRQFFIIALGEMILVAGVTFTSRTLTISAGAAFSATFATTVLMWRIYVHRAGEMLPSALAMARLPGRLALWLSAAHLVMVIGIVAAAAGFDLVILHPFGHAEEAWVAVILGGPAMFLVGRGALEYGVFHRLSPSRGFGVVVFAAAGAPMVRAPALAAAMVPIAVLLVVATWDAMRGRMRAVEPSPP